MAILGGAALLLFGPEQLPKIARRVGGVVREVQNTSQSFIREMERAADLTEEKERAERAAALPSVAGMPDFPPPESYVPPPEVHYAAPPALHEGPVPDFHHEPVQESLLPPAPAEPVQPTMFEQPRN